MAFKNDNLKVLFNAAGNGPKIWCYYNEGGDTVTTAGYFPKTAGIKNNDIALVLAKDAGGVPTFHKLAVNSSTGVITASALAYYTAPSNA